MVRKSPATYAPSGPFGVPMAWGAAVTILSFALPPGTATFLSASVKAGAGATGEDLIHLGAVVGATVGRHGSVQGPIKLRQARS